MKVKIAQLCPTLCDPHGLYSPWNSPGQNTRVERLALLQGNLPNPGIEPRSPTLQADYFPAEPQGKSKNTGVGSLSLLQQIFLIQELNQGLLRCRQILSQLSSQGIRLPVQVGSLVWEDPACCGAAKPMCHKCGACALEPVLCNKRSHQNGKLVYCNKDPEKAKTIFLKKT